MNCYYHEDRPAVASCVKCGAGLCRSCREEAVYEMDGKPVCLNCSRPIAEAELNEAQSTRVWSLVKCIFSGVCLGIALAAFLSGADIMQIWIIAGVAGLPTAFKSSHRSREQRIMDEIEDRYTKDVIDLMARWAFRLIFKLIFIIGLAPLCAVITFIKNLVRFLKSGSQIKNAQRELDYIDQLLYGEPPMQEEAPAPAPAAVLPAPEAEPQRQPAAPAQAQDYSAYMPPTAPAPAQDYSAYMPQTARPQTPEPVRTPEASAPAPARLEAPAPEAAHTVPPRTQSPAAPAQKKGNGAAIGIAVAVVAVIALVAGYFLWYIPYAKDRDALRTYVLATNLFMRSSQVAGVEYNVVDKLPYGSELITYNISGEWAEVKVNGTTGYVASAHLLGQADFNLLHSAWGDLDARDCITSSKCRLAILDYYKSHGLTGGSSGWQIYTKQKDRKPNTVFYPRLYDKGSKFTDFIFLVKNNATGERMLACYSFEDDTERPVFRFEAAAPTDGYIRSVQGNRTGARILFDTGATLNVNF